MSAELALMMNVNGGNVIWVCILIRVVLKDQVQHAFGDFFGFINAYTNLINSLASQAILAVLFVNYLSSEFPFEEAEIWGIRIGFVGVVTLINIKGIASALPTNSRSGMELISSISTFLLIFIFSPFITEMFVAYFDRIPIDFHVCRSQVKL